MILLWVTLLLLHQGYTLVPVTTVQVGESATFTCVFPVEELSNIVHKWYKQRAGDTLKLIMTVWKKNPQYTTEFSESKFTVNTDKNSSYLTILRIIQEDEGMYHCAITDWTVPEWSGTYLLVKGNTQRTSNYTVIHGPTVSDPDRTGDSMTLQCSVLSDSDNKTCPGDHSVYWFRAGSDKSHPDIIYTDGNGRDECDKRSDSQKSCVYHFSKNISSSDAGTYYCAVATCGEILFGDGTKVENVQTPHSIFIAMAILIVCLVISVAGNVVLICKRKVHKQYEGMESAVSEAQHDNSCQPAHDTTETDDQLKYAALNFSEKNTRGRKRREFAEDSVYSQVKC
ncbi:signal-regulatory protein beta-2-like [Micropterus salmoides]|uniref:signal-regulatory protein beta-2-like n=1 Tax=Micropterus salmoides TaxID=27706 RepID=UPI0018EC2878|nr:signal-regulatory protein beta-2-like [Micropterus salmoides]